MNTILMSLIMMTMTYEMPKLPYANNALEPVISQQTIDFHYGKHLQTYVNNLNSLVPGTEYEGKTVEEIVAAAPEAIKRDFGSFENFKKEFNAAAVGLFGSGWAWLSVDKDGKLKITKEGNGSNPVRAGLKPLLGFDVWEHSYYLDYQNRRADHVNALWDIIDWDVVEKRM